MFKLKPPEDFFLCFKLINPFPHTTIMQQTTIKHVPVVKNIEKHYKCKFCYQKELKALWQMEKLLIMSNFSSATMFSKLSAENASESGKGLKCNQNHIWIML